MAKNGDALAIVGRRKDPLVQAKDRLIRLGASSVATLAGDLLDPAFREVIKNFRPVCDSVLVGGPSPPLGGRNYCTAHTGVKSPEWVAKQHLPIHMTSQDGHLNAVFKITERSFL